MWKRQVAGVFAVGLTIASIGLGSCDTRSFIPSDGTGFGVWVTNDTGRQMLVGFEPGSGNGAMWNVPPGAIDGRGPWISFDVDGSGGDRGHVLLYEEDCDLIEALDVGAGEYRVRVGAGGTVTVSPEDVRNDTGEALSPASTTC